MSDIRIRQSRVEAGVWRLLVESNAPLPDLRVRYLDEELPGLESTESAEGPVLTLPIPAQLLSDRVQTLVLETVAGGEIVATLSLAAGQPLAGDLAAEVAQLRGEVEMLKGWLFRIMGDGAV